MSFGLAYDGTRRYNGEILPFADPLSIKDVEVIGKRVHIARG